MSAPSNLLVDADILSPIDPRMVGGSVQGAFTKTHGKGSNDEGRKSDFGTLARGFCS